jgi:hypothetical protein
MKRNISTATTDVVLEGVEICEVTWFWKLRRWQPGNKPGGIPTYDWVRGEMNCVCNEPNETCKKLAPGLVPFFVFLEEYGWEQPDAI